MDNSHEGPHATMGEARPGVTGLERIPKLPVFLDLQGHKALLAGDTPGLAWKAELIASAGANVHIASPEPCEALLALAARDAAEGRVRLEKRHWQASDLQGAAIAVADLETEAAAAAFHAAGRAAGVIVNTIDKGATCDFYFGAIVSRAPVVIGITTDGTVPILGQTIRRLIEIALPAWLGEWADFARTIRAEVKRRLSPGIERRAFWEAFIDRAFAAPKTAAIEKTVLNALVDAAARAPKEGRIFVVPPPAHVDDLTLRDAKRLQSADVIVHETGLEAGVVTFFRREAIRLTLSSVTGPGTVAPAALPGLLAELQKAGKTIVVLNQPEPVSAMQGAAS